MKILMINKFLHKVGGAEAYTLKLGKFIQSQGHEVQFFGMDHKNRCVGNALNIYAEEKDFRNTSSINKIIYSFRTIYSFDAKKKLGVILDDFKPDICHLNNINFQLTPAIIYEIKKKKIPILQTVHDVQIACPCHRFYIEHKKKICDNCKTGKFWNCIKNRCVHGSILKSCVAAMESYYYHIRNTYNLVDKYIAPSKFIAEQLIVAGVDKERIIVKYNFSDDLDDFVPSNIDEKYALYFGRLSEEKGIRSLLEVCQTLKDIRVIIAGSGPLESVVEEKVKSLKNINFVGFKSGNELKQLIAGARFCIYPSEWYENCPLSIIESESLGTPVIGSNLGGTNELIEPGKTGLLFEGCNKDELAHAMILLWRNDVLTDKMKDNCLNVKSNTIKTYSKHLLELYMELIIR